jgi:hypothetical protein
VRLARGLAIAIDHEQSQRHFRVPLFAGFPLNGPIWEPPETGGAVGLVPLCVQLA